MMLTFLFGAPLALSLRLFFLQVPAQLGLAFLAGLMMSIWSVCFSPTLAKLTTQENRTFGFSLFVATGIASGAVAGLIGGYLPGLFHHSRWGGPQVDGIRVVLFFACAIIMLAAVAVLRLRLEKKESISSDVKIFNRFLTRFLIAVATWNFAISFFVPFANVYLSRQLRLSTVHIGEIFTVSQLAQVAMVLAAPILYRKFGLVTGIALTQAGTGLLFFALSGPVRTSTAVWFYLLLNGLQWMGGPGISSLLMNQTVETNRSRASAVHNIVNLGTQAAAAVIAGNMFERFGYSGPLAMDGVLAALAAFFMFSLLGNNEI
jgi:MFS family permease